MSSRQQQLVHSEEAVLITSDEQSIVFLETENAALAKPKRFITLKLDKRNVLVRAASLDWVYRALQARLKSNVWDEEGEAAAAAEDAARREQKAAR